MQENSNYRPVSVGEWIGTWLLCCIPIVNYILLFVWAFGATAKPSKKTYARAMLLMSLITIIISFLVIIVIAIIAVATGVGFEALLSGGF